MTSPEPRPAPRSSSTPPSPEKSLVRQNAEADPSYAPYCMRCKGLGRMQKVEPFLWKHHCGAIHDERSPATPSSPEPGTTNELPETLKLVVEGLSWALDILDMYDERLIGLGEPREKVYSEVHLAAKQKARAALRLRSLK